MDFMSALSKANRSERTSSSCTNSSADYYTITDDEDTSTLANYKTLSLSADSTVDSNENEKHKCTICIRQFNTLQECMRHELLEHMDSEKIPQKKVRTSFSRLLLAFEQSEQQYNRQRIHEMFERCRFGMELYELFKVYCVSFDRSNEIISNVKRCLLMDLRSLERVEVNTYGSCENGLMMWDSDIDIYVTVPNPNNRFRYDSRGNGTCYRNTFENENRWIRQIYNRINSCLRRGQHFDEIIVIRQARVPIIKCRHIKSGMRVDINNSCPNSTVNTEILRKLILFDVRIHNFMRFMKIWAKKLCIAGRNRMTSYCFYTLLIFCLQQRHNYCQRPLVPPIEQLQLNVPPKMLNCINYAFDLQQHMWPISKKITTSALIRGFFIYYHDVTFTNQIIAPYLGKIIPFEDFLSGKFKYTTYLNQLESMRMYAQFNSHDKNLIKIEELNSHQPMIVQDPFQLNHNISRGVTVSQLDYFRKCIEYGYQICMDSKINTDAKLYEALLFDIVGNIRAEAKQLNNNCTGRNSMMLQPHELMYNFTPTRNEIRAIRAQQQHNTLKSKDSKLTEDNDVNVNIFELWMVHYIEAIYVILTQVYRFKVELLNDIDDPYDENLLQRHMYRPATVSEDDTFDSDQIINSIREFKEKNEVVWIISTGLNTWSEREFQRGSDQSFMSFQYAQTRKLLEQRQGKSIFDVKMLGRLSLKALENFKTLELVLKNHQQTREGFCKKQPMPKFFSNLRVCLQNFNLKEKLQMDHENRFGMPCNSESQSHGNLR